MSRELKPCPFCGSTDTFSEQADFSASYIVCNNCCARGPVDCQDDDDEEQPGRDAAIRSWNTRPTCNAPLQVPAQSGEVREKVARADFDLSQHSDPEFIAAWTEMEAIGFRYSESNVEKVHLGWIMARQFLAPAIDGREVVGPNPCVMGYCPKDDPHCEGCVNPFIEQCAIAARDAMVTMPWPPQDGDEQVDAVMAAIRKLALTPSDGE